MTKVLSSPKLALIATLAASLPTAYADTVTPRIPAADQVWTGPDLWANPMEDWVVEDGVARNTHSGGDRELVILTAELNEQQAGFAISATFDLDEKPKGPGFIGFQVGLQGAFDDYRDSAIYGSGIAVGVNEKGQPFIGDHLGKEGVVTFNGEPIKIEFSVGQIGSEGGKDQSVQLKIGDSRSGKITLYTTGTYDWSGLASYTISSQKAPGVACAHERPARTPSVRQDRGGNWTGTISEMSLTGEKVTAHPERAFGPILWTQHTLEHGGKLNLIAQFAPLNTSDAQATLFVDGKEAASVAIDPNARVAQFRIEEIDTTVDHQYVVKFGSAEYTGTIRKEPLDKTSLTVAALSCNDSTGFPHNLLVDNVISHKPDVLAFMGDQIYEPIGGYGLLFGDNNTEYDDRSFICYLRKYAMHGWSWRELMRDTPTFALPDDHDVFHGNVWGEGGKLADRSGGIYAPAQDSGGYKMSAEFVNAVQLTQTGSLPAPVDPAPIKNDITVYFTDWHYGGIDMAVLADRQFKSAPKALLPDSKIRNGWPQNHDFQRPALTDPRVLDHPDAQLLGQRQEAFLAQWADTKPEDTDWRLVISASPLMTLQTIPENEFSDGVVPGLKKPRPGEYPENDIPKLDYDSNGWPHSKRDLATELITKAHAVHVTGDQHLGSTGQYGVKEFNDSAWWISSPAIANLWPRRWFPKDGGANRRDGDPKYTGEFEDGFGNKMTLHAASNPYDIDREPARLYDKAVGYSVLTLDRESGNITLANWPYYSSPNGAAPDNIPYPGWPITIDPKTNKRIK